MSANSKIEWTDHSWNPWWGCLKVSPGCDNCYAESFAKRLGFNIWGKDAKRREFGPAHWAEPLKWNASCEARKVREKVFCGSMCDFFEDRPDIAEARLLALDTIRRTPALDWIVVTKRPQSIPRMMPEQWKKAPLRNLWLLVTIEGPDYYWRWHQLAKVRAAVRGISYEPALGPLSLDAMGAVTSYDDWEGDPSVPNGTRHFTARETAVDWVIAGEESGSGARQAQERWFTDLRDECIDLGVAFFMKQQMDFDTGRKIPFEDIRSDLQIREYPRAA